MPTKPRSRCPDCHQLHAGTGRCARCSTRAKRQVRPYTSAERTRRAAAVATWRAEHGDWCPGWRRPGHPARDLTADHIQAVAAGGREDGPLGVLCVSCNGRKAARGT
ncbi:hypothetical protein [Nonomuraea endophytica]|uniref:hypothetical protein n=1 Tax=Nonomuraea endophytica TaxID=714136 RepID=UPI0037C981C4